MKIRVRGWINAEGRWAVLGADWMTPEAADADLADIMDAGDDMGRPFWLVAEVEAPTDIEVPATEEPGQ